MRAKPLFRWTHANRDVRDRMNLAVAIQTFFYKLVEERLGATEAATAYSTEIAVIKETMTEVGVTVDEPAWFKNLLK